MLNDSNNAKKSNANRDDLTGEPGSHPIGTALGAGSAAAAGAVAGSVLGPIGTAAGAIAGAVIGGIAGGYAGKGIAEVLNPTVINDYWTTNYKSRPYVDQSKPFAEYKSAYDYGYNSRVKNPTAKYEDIESSLSQNWNSSRGDSKLEWDHAKEAVKDSYNTTDTLYKNKLASNN